MAKAKATAVDTQQQLGAPPPTDTGSSALAVPSLDELDGLGIDDVVANDDGLGQVDADDIKIPVYVLNMKGKGADGRALPIDEYYNTVDETSKRTVNAAFLHLHKSHLYSKWNNAEKRTEIFCRSYDRVTGTWVADGHLRPCKGCPDFEWRRDADGKRTRNCGPVYNMFAIDRDDSMPFVVRYKRTSLPVIKSHLQRHHIGRRIAKVKDPATGETKTERLNYPLQVFAVTMEAEISDSKGDAYAVPTLQRGAVLAAEEIASLTESARTLRESVLPILMHVEKVAAERGEGDDSGGGDTSFEPNKYAADEGKDFAGSDAAASGDIKF